MVVGAPAHPVALDNVEVLEVDQWLALLIIGDLDPLHPARHGARTTPHQIGEEPHYLRSGNTVNGLCSKIPSRVY